MCGMGNSRIFLLIACFSVSAMLMVAPETIVKAQSRPALNTATIKLRVQRGSPADLEIGGDLKGLPAGATRYITRDDLLALPQVTYAVTDDPNFGKSARIQGVLLETLLRDLGAAPTADLVVATCGDKYRANYPREYLLSHHPVLVLEVNGEPPSGWPKDSATHDFDMGPYMISHEKFTTNASDRLHDDEPQIPWGIVRLDFRSEKTVFGPIMPRGSRASELAAQVGYRIAQQNCFRCHNMGTEGGQKSGIPWQVLAQVAANSPELFTEYVRDPKSKNRQAQMPPNLQYDSTAMRGLVDYFRTFVQQEKR
jgi:mono/diheme cytochrome c family protein